MARLDRIIKNTIDPKMSLRDYVDELSKPRYLSPTPCEGHWNECGNTPTRLCPAATAYANPEDNKPLRLCRECADEYYEYWDQMWHDYYSGIL